MNKQELVEYVANECSVSKACGEKAVSAVLNGIKQGLKKPNEAGKHEVRLIGFGTFSVKERKARKGRNPKTGAIINIKASKTVKFSVGQDFKKVVAKCGSALTGKMKKK